MGCPVRHKTAGKIPPRTVGITPMLSAVIPAYNEEETVATVVRGAAKHVDEVIVIDDGSTDKTAENAREAGAKVIKQENAGVLEATQRGIRGAKGDFIVTLDADGQHNPEEIPELVQPLLNDEADLVLGKRPNFPHFSEWLITKLVELKTPCADASTGFRAIKSELAQKMEFHGECPCGTLVLEAHHHEARITNVSISIRKRLQNDRRIHPKHLKQILWIIYDLLRY